MKRAVWIITTLLIILWACLITAFVSNRIDISRYNKGKYQKNNLAMFGFTQPYVDAYNMGNKYYRQGDYDIAVEEYKEALGKNPPHRHNDSHINECEIRINMALAMVADLQIDTATKDEIPDILKEIDEAKKVLTEKQCAQNQEKGHNSKAIQLYKDLCAAEEELKSKQKEPEESDPEDKKSDQDDKQETGDNLEKKQEELQKNQKEGTSSRSASLSEARELIDDTHMFYDGPCW